MRASMPHRARAEAWPPPPAAIRYAGTPTDGRRRSPIVLLERLVLLDRLVLLGRLAAIP